MSNLPAQIKHQGFSLLELLVTLLILSIGLLGLAAVQTISIKNVNNSQFRTVATHYAYDIAERMRANRSGVDSGYYAAIDGTEADQACTPCNALQLAQHDAYEWNQIIKNSPNSGGLPDGKGTVTQNSGVHDIVVSWSEQTRSAAGGNVATQSITLSIRI